MEPVVEYKLKVFVEGKEVYYVVAHSMNILELCLGDAEQKALDAVDDLLDDHVLPILEKPDGLR